MKNLSSRRQFLQRLSYLLAAGSVFPAAGLFSESAAKGGSGKPVSAAKGGSQKGSAANKGTTPQPTANSALHYRIAEWTGDDPTIGHRFRNGDVPSGFPTTPERTVDFVVVGGGLAGLTSAYYLKDHDFILLEQYAEAGGQSRGGTFQGIDYSWGPAFVDTIDGIYGQLYSELGIVPTKVPAAGEFFDGKHWVAGVDAKSSNALYEDYRRLREQTKRALAQYPAQLTPESTDTPDLQKLDAMPFSQLLKGSGQEFMSMMQSACKSATCGTVDQISALAGIGMTADISSTNYVFEGGNPAIAKALAKKVKENGDNRLVTGAFVWQVRLNADGANILYSTADGALHNIACKHVIIATPPMIAWRQVSGMEDKMKANLMGFKYGPYLVANCLLKSQLFTEGGNNWISGPTGFTDVVVAETPYKLQGKYKPSMGSVLTLYHPWEPISPGRPLLLAGNKEEFAKTATEQLAMLVEHLDKNLEEVVLSRFGHGLIVPGPNHFARLRRILAAYSGPYTLAYSATQGIQCAESAINAAKFATTRAMAGAAKTSWVVPGLASS